MGMVTKHKTVKVPRIRMSLMEIWITWLRVADTWWEFPVTMIVTISKYLFSFVFGQAVSYKLSSGNMQSCIH